MAVLFLAIIGLAAVWGQTGEGLFYNCTKHNTNDASKYTEAAANCTETFWCIWEPTGHTCIYDSCLKWIADTDTTSCVPTGGLTCELRYLTDTINCSNGNPLQVDRFCRVSGTTHQKRLLSGETCFYEDLKSIAGSTDASASRLCTNKVCSWVEQSGGKFCDFGGGEDCSAYTDPELLCPCLGKDYCDLHPKCKLTSNTCARDPCYDASPVSGQAVGTNCIRPPATPATDCIARYEYTYVEGSGVQLTTFCTSTNTQHKPNECYGAVSRTLVPSTYGSVCDTYTYDESVCNNALALNESANPPVVPSEGATNCTLVDIAGGFFSSSKYCTDGDRTVPSPSSAFLIKTPYLLVFLAVALFSLL